MGLGRPGVEFLIVRLESELQKISRLAYFVNFGDILCLCDWVEKAGYRSTLVGPVPGEERLTSSYIVMISQM